MPEQITAVEMARATGIDPKRLRAALRKEELPWHRFNDRWAVFEGTSEHDDMLRVLRRLMGTS